MLLYKKPSLPLQSYPLYKSISLDMRALQSLPGCLNCPNRTDGNFFMGIFSFISTAYDYIFSVKIYVHYDKGEIHIDAEKSNACFS